MKITYKTMMKITYKTMLDQVKTETISEALSYAEMAWDIAGYKPVFIDENGNVVDYRFNAWGQAVLVK